MIVGLLTSRGQSKLEYQKISGITIMVLDTLFLNPRRVFRSNLNISCISKVIKESRQL